MYRGLGRYLLTDGRADFFHPHTVEMGANHLLYGAVQRWWIAASLSIQLDASVVTTKKIRPDMPY